MIEKIKTYAIEHNVPIICEEGLRFLKDILIKYQVKDVLEIGTAIGYSSIEMALNGCDVDTFERDIHMIEQAKKNIKSLDLEHKIRLITEDALLYNGELKSSYDLIFIDAAKAQYQKFFEKFESRLSKEGIIVCDNLSFHHLDKTKVNRNTRQLLIKLENFVDFLKTNESFETTFYDVGDGMSISKRIIK